MTSDKLRLNKTSLREQGEALRTYLEFLPTLRLRQQQLQRALAQVEHRAAAAERQQAELRAEVRPWASLLRGLLPAVRPLAEVARVETLPSNVAGVEVPQLHAVHFVPREHELLATPLVFDDAVAVLRRAARLRAERAVLERQRERLAQELSRTSQRINLYDEVLIPRTRADIRRLRVYLGDQQTAAVCRAKRAKTKAQARAAARAEGGEHGHR